MSQEITDNLSNQSFEQRVFARFDAIDENFRTVFSILQDHGERLNKLEAKSYDIKPIWERALAEILENRRAVAELKREIGDLRREVTRRLDRIEAVVLENRADLSEAMERIEALESKPA